MGADLCSTLGWDEQMICVLAWGCLPPLLGVGAGGGRPSHYHYGGPRILTPGKLGYFTSHAFRCICVILFPEFPSNNAYADSKYRQLWRLATSVIYILTHRNTRQSGKILGVGWDIRYVVLQPNYCARGRSLLSPVSAPMVQSSRKAILAIISHTNIHQIWHRTL